MTLTGTIALKNPSNIAAGQSGIIYLSQDGTGSRTWSAESYWDFPDGGTLPTLSTGANAVDRIDYFVAAADKIHCVASLGMA